MDFQRRVCTVVILLLLGAGCTQNPDSVQWKVTKQHQVTQESHWKTSEKFAEQTRDANEQQVQLLSKVVDILKDKQGSSIELETPFPKYFGSAGTMTLEIPDPPVDDSSGASVPDGPEPARADAASTDDAASEQKPRYLVMYTASWCGACRQWKDNERAAIEAAGFIVEEYDTDARPDLKRQHGITTLPSFHVCDSAKRTVTSNLLTGYWSSGLLLQKLRATGVRSTAPQSPPLSPQSSSAGPIITRPGWGTVDLRTYSMPDCNCNMCREIRALQRANGYPVREYGSRQPARKINWFRINVQPAQEAIGDHEMYESLKYLNLTKSDVFGEIGCGDGRVLIEAHLKSGCYCVGIELDPKQAERAKVNVRNAGLSEFIDIIEGDARDFRPADHGITAGYVYLYPDLLEELSPMLQQIPRLASPWHPVAGMEGEKRGNIYLYES